MSKVKRTDNLYQCRKLHATNKSRFTYVLKGCTAFSMVNGDYLTKTHPHRIPKENRTVSQHDYSLIELFAPQDVKNFADDARRDL